MSHKEITRRQAMATLLLAPVGVYLAGCEKRYVRPAGDHNLGAPQDLLYSKQIVRDRQMLVMRDDRGWAAMSIQCAYEGCELSYQDQRFLCLCCNSVYDHNGKVLKGPSKYDLPYFQIRFVEGNLYANSGKIVSPEERFTTPELEEAIARLAERIKREGTRTGMRIPDILLGKGDGELPPEGMFRERPLTD